MRIDLACMLTSPGYRRCLSYICKWMGCFHQVAGYDY